MTIQGVLDHFPAINPFKININNPTTKTYDHRPTEILRFFISEINCRLKSGQFTQTIETTGHTYRIELSAADCSSLNVWYELERNNKNQYIKDDSDYDLKSIIVEHFINSGWQYCFVDIYSNFKYTIVLKP